MAGRKRPRRKIFTPFAVIHSTANVFLRIMHGLVDLQYRTDTAKTLPRIASYFPLKTRKYFPLRMLSRTRYLATPGRQFIHLLAPCSKYTCMLITNSMTNSYRAHTLSWKLRLPINSSRLYNKIAIMHVASYTRIRHACSYGELWSKLCMHGQ